MSAQYWIRRKERITGPFSADQIRQMASAGMLAEDDMMSDDQVHFKPAGRISGLLLGADQSSAPVQPTVPSESGPNTQSKPAAAQERPQNKLPLLIRLLIWFVAFVGGMLGAVVCQSVFEVKHQVALVWTLLPFFFFFLMWHPTSIRKA